MKTPDELKEAVSSFQQGNKESFNKIYEISYRYLYTCVIHVVKDEDAAMDMLQETYMEVSRSIQQLKSAEDFLSWAAMIANRKCFAYLKKNRNLSGIENETYEDENGDILDNLADDDAIIPEEILQDREKKRLIREIVDNLSDMQRLCVIGYYYNEQKQEEIAQELGIPVNTVKTNLSRAKANIKEALIEMDVKKGTRLYSFAPFMLLFFSMEAEACELKPMDFSTDGDKTGIHNEIAHVPKMALKTKVIIGAVVIGGITAAVIIPNLFKGRSTVSQQPQNQINMAAEESQRTVSELAETINMAESVAETEETIQADAAISEKSVTGYAISEKYYSYGLANQGLIPVLNSNGKYGLVTYDNQIVVPFEYSSGCEMVNEEGQSFFEKDGVYTVFDRDGNELFQTERTVCSVNEGIIFTMDRWNYDIRYAYYDIGGNLIYDSAENLPEGYDDYFNEGNAVGFNEGYALFGESADRMDKDGTIVPMCDLVYPENFTGGQDNQLQDSEEGRIVVDVRYQSSLLDIPLFPVKDDYYLAKAPMVLSDSYGIYTLRNVNGNPAYEWDISNIFNKENLSFSQSDADWDFAGYYDNGTAFCNNGTIMCAHIDADGERIYYLVDVSKMTSQEYVPSGEYYSDEDYWDFDTTALTDDALLARADYIGMNRENYWLIRNGEKWGYIDHAGSVMAMYDDATDFHAGKAVVIEDGTAYVIDESFNKVQEIGKANGVSNYGELFAVRNAGELFGQMIRLD